MITAEELRSILDYSPDTGEFRWRHDCKWKRYASGDIAGSNNGQERWRIQINKRGYFAHRLAWLYVHGRWPSQYVDHINHNGLDNRLSNLREADATQNQANKRRCRRNSSGFKGVKRCPRTGRWVARIRILGKQTHLGTFDTAEFAASAYLSAAKAAFGEFAFA